MHSFSENETEIEVIDKRVIKRITIRNFVAEVFDAFNITRGGIYSFKLLMTNPGRLVRDYIGTERYRITAPFKILIISTTIILILFNAIDAFQTFFGDSLIIEGGSQNDLKEQIILMFSNYFNLILWSYIPISALISFWFNRKQGINYAENLVFQTFVLSLTNCVAILFFPVNFISFTVFLVVYQIVAAFYMVYAYKVFFQKKWLRVIFENLVIFAVGGTLWTALLVTVIVAIALVLAQ